MKALRDLSALSTRERIREALGPCTPDVDPLAHAEGIVSVVCDARFTQSELLRAQTERIAKSQEAAA